MRFPATFALFTGILMVVQWALSLAMNQVPELQTATWEIALHLAAEGVTASLLILSGIGLLRHTAWARSLYFVAAGMLLYTVIASPGYFAQRGQWLPVVLFAVLLALTISAVRRLTLSR
jgi:hypothetical protein